MGNIIAKSPTVGATDPKKPEIPSRDTEGYRVLSKKVEEIKIEERIKEYYIV